MSGPVKDLVLVLSTSNTNYAPVATSDKYFEEGELVGSFQNGVGVPLRVPGMGAFQTQVGTTLAALGYRGWIVMTLHLTDQVPLEPTTWSGIKSLYAR